MGAEEKSNKAGRSGFQPETLALYVYPNATATRPRRPELHFARVTNYYATYHWFKAPKMNTMMINKLAILLQPRRGKSLGYGSAERRGMAGRAEVQTISQIFAFFQQLQLSQTPKIPLFVFVLLSDKSLPYSIRRSLRLFF